MNLHQKVWSIELHVLPL